MNQWEHLLAQGLPVLLITFFLWGAAKVLWPEFKQQLNDYEKRHTDTIREAMRMNNTLISGEVKLTRCVYCDTKWILNKCPNCGAPKHTS